MPDPTFTWCDLSTFDLARACAFYGGVFGWSAHNVGGVVGDDYTLMYAGSRSSAGLYTMPEFFVKIRMPSFWMSYVSVDAIEHTVARSVKLGAKCEVEPTALDADSRFALIRDPSGAGFTLYEGPGLDGRDAAGRHGRMVWNELHVPSLDLVDGFYRELFGWTIAADPAFAGRHSVSGSTGRPIASILVADEAYKGPKNYWAVLFAVDDLNAALAAVTNHGGSVLVRPGEGLDYAMATDDQDAMFCLCEAG